MFSHIEPAAVIFDATFLQHLDRPSSVKKIDAHCRAAHLCMYPTVVNAFEALKHEREVFRRDRLEALRRWQAPCGLLPWPPEILARAGYAIAQGKAVFDVHGCTLDKIIADQAQERADSEAVRRFIDGSESRFNALFSSLRPAMQVEVRERGLRSAWPSAYEFLVTAWRDPRNRAAVAEELWRGVAGETAPSVAGEILMRSEAWRLAIDALGTAMYDRVVKHEHRRNAPSQADLLQLVYLSRHTRARLFVTDDKSLIMAAQAVVLNEYPNIRILTSEEFLA